MTRRANWKFNERNIADKYRDRKLRSFRYSLSVQLQSSNRKRATVNPLSSMSKDSYCLLPGGRIRMFPESGSLCHVGLDGGGQERRRKWQEQERTEGGRERERDAGSEKILQVATIVEDRKRRTWS